MATANDMEKGVKQVILQLNNEHFVRDIYVL